MVICINRVTLFSKLFFNYTYKNIGRSNLRKPAKGKKIEHMQKVRKCPKNRSSKLGLGVFQGRVSKLVKDSWENPEKWPESGLNIIS